MTQTTSTTAPGGLIAPHDRRVRVFVSSTLIELAAEIDWVMGLVSSQTRRHRQDMDVTGEPSTW